MGTTATRRELLLRYLPAATAVMLAQGVQAAPAIAGGAGDGEALAATLAVEQLVVFCYEHVRAVGPLGHGARRLVDLGLAHEHVHVSLLLARLAALGQSPPAGPASVAAAADALGKHGVSASLTDLRTEHSSVRLLVQVETVVEGAYFEAIAKLRDARLLTLCAQIMACEAQHWTALVSFAHHGDVTISVPAPVVEGE